MPLFERTFTTILGDAMLELTKNTRITRVSPGAKARTLIEILSRNLNTAYRTFDINFARAFLSGADGSFLDLIGELLGTPRLGSSTASAQASTEIIKFFVESDTFGDINDSTSITIPAGTIISTEENGGVSYKMTVGVVLSASAAEQFVSVIALTPGDTSNVGSNTLNFHSFTNYTDIDNNTLKVTNVAGIFSGTNFESDINYRFRLSRSALSSEAANETSVLLAALAVPGVANVIIQNRAIGIGTFRILIKAVTPTVSDSLIDAVNAALSVVAAEGIRGIADKPYETGIGFTITLTYKTNISNEEKDALDEQARLAIEDYVNNLDIGEEFILNELVERVLSVSPNIKDMGEPNHPIDDMFVFKQSRLRDNKVREELISNYIPKGNERVIIETTIKQPITINRAN